MTRASFRAHLIRKQRLIIFESPEDEGAAEYHAELESVIEATRGGHRSIQDACDWVGEQNLVTSKEGFCSFCALSKELYPYPFPHPDTCVDCDEQMDDERGGEHE